MVFLFGVHFVVLHALANLYDYDNIDVTTQPTINVTR